MYKGKAVGETNCRVVLNRLKDVLYNVGNRANDLVIDVKENVVFRIFIKIKLIFIKVLQSLRAKNSP